MREKIGYFHILGTLLGLALLAAPLHAAETGSYRTKSGDIGLERSESLSALAIKARNLFEIGMDREEPRKLAAAAEIMARLTDVIDLRTVQTAPPTDMSAQAILKQETRTSGFSPILFTPSQVMDMAIAMAQRQGEPKLAEDLTDAKASMKLAEKRAGQGCVWANCCGRWGCWRWCQWW